MNLPATVHVKAKLDRKHFVATVTFTIEPTDGTPIHAGELRIPLRFWYILRLGFRLSEANHLNPIRLIEEET